MSATVVEVQEARTRLAELIDLAASGTEVILTEGNVPRARLVPVPTTGRPRVAGLHAGSLQPAADFDAPLPEDFWAGLS